MKTKTFLLGVLAALLALLTLFFPASSVMSSYFHSSSFQKASPSTAYPFVLFQDNFDDGDADGWTVSESGVWYVENGEYVVDMGEGQYLTGIALAGDDAWRDYTLDLDVKGEAGFDKGILFRCNDIWNGCYYVNLVSDPSNQVLLGRLVNHVGETLSSALYPNTNGMWYHVTIKLAGLNIRVYVNDQLQIDYTADHSTYVAQGKIGLCGYTSTGGLDKIRFDNVIVMGAYVLYMPEIIR